MMDSAVIFCSLSHSVITVKANPRDEPAFGQRMLENHLSQDHDWASRRLTVIEQQVTWITRRCQWRPHSLGCGRFYTRLLAERGFHCTGVDFSLRHPSHGNKPAGASRKPEY